MRPLEVGDTLYTVEQMTICTYKVIKRTYTNIDDQNKGEKEIREYNIERITILSNSLKCSKTIKDNELIEDKEMYIKADHLMYFYRKKDIITYLMEQL